VDVFGPFSFVCAMQRMLCYVMLCCVMLFSRRARDVSLALSDAADRECGVSGMGMSLWAVAAIAGIIAPCHGHGHMTLPPSRNGGTLARAADCLHGECMWFSQPTHIPGEPTLNAAPLRTFNVDVSEGAHDYSRKNPWRSPGAASVIGSGCGRAGGGPVRSMNGGTAKEFNLTQDMDGADLPVGPRTVWRRGAEEEVAWAVNANHGVRAPAASRNAPLCASTLVRARARDRATHTRMVRRRGQGGYSYRLCAVGDATSGGPTEECFQRGSLSFGKEATSWLQWLNPTPGAAPHPLHQRGGDGGMASSRVPIARVTVSTGTHPAGSEVRRQRSAQTAPSAGPAQRPAQRPAAGFTAARSPTPCRLLSRVCARACSGCATPSQHAASARRASVRAAATPPTARAAARPCRSPTTTASTRHGGASRTASQRRLATGCPDRARSARPNSPSRSPG
jgi:hypothetical protein